MVGTVKNSTRIEVVDALRGFAVLAILLVHNLEHFIYPVYPENSVAWLSILDKGVNSVVFTLFAGKAYAIFALLFGFTFYIQSNNQQKKGKDFGYRFLWRLVLLVGFATLNAAFFPAGDVLLLFSMVGIVFFLTRKWGDKAILITAIIFLFQPVEWFHFIANLINPAHQIPDSSVGAMYDKMGINTEKGDFWQFIWYNVTLGQKASFLWAVDAGRFVQTAGLFLLGSFLGRKQLFLTSEKNYQFWVKTLVAGAVLFAPLFGLKEMIMENGSPIAQKTVGTALNMWQNLAFTFVLIASFVLLYQTKRFSNLVSDLRFYGKMSLTNYVSQSLIGAFIYFPIALNLAQYSGMTVSLLIGILTFFFQVKFSKWWLSKYRQGPLETLWHKWTWIDSEKRKKQISHTS